MISVEGLNSGLYYSKNGLVLVNLAMITNFETFVCSDLEGGSVQISSGLSKVRTISTFVTCIGKSLEVIGFGLVNDPHGHRRAASEVPLVGVKAGSTIFECRNAVQYQSLSNRL